MLFYQFSICRASVVGVLYRSYANLSVLEIYFFKVFLATMAFISVDIT